MKVKFANKVFEVLYTMEVAGKTMYAVEDEPNHIDWLVNVEVVDDEKKESDKSEQEPYPETLDKAIDLYYYTYGNGREGFDHLSLEQFKDIVKTFVDDYGMQKPAWSEEDEREVAVLEAYIRSKDWSDRHIDRALGIVDELVKKLKSLKDRVQPKPKQEWSGEDEIMFNVIISELLQIPLFPSVYNKEKIIQIQKRINWLKSLKDRVQPQNTWKPTEFELYVLKLVAEKDGTCLMGLYEQLKKLREE